MTQLQTAGVIIVAAVLVIGFLRLFKTPLRLLLKLLVNTALGFIALVLINFFGAFLGVGIGINWINAVIIGVFGVPGAALLLIVNWLALL